MKWARLLWDMLNNPLTPLSGATLQELLHSRMRAPMSMHAVNLGVLTSCRNSSQMDNIRYPKVLLTQQARKEMFLPVRSWLG